MTKNKVSKKRRPRISRAEKSVSQKISVYIFTNGKKCDKINRSFGSVAQLVRVPASHAGGPRFEPARFHHHKSVIMGFPRYHWPICSMILRTLVNDNSLSYYHWSIFKLAFASVYRLHAAQVTFSSGWAPLLTISVQAIEAATGS